MKKQSPLILCLCVFSVAVIVVYVKIARCEQRSKVLRKLTSKAQVSRLFGQPSYVEYSGDGPSRKEAWLYEPEGYGCKQDSTAVVFDVHGQIQRVFDYETPEGSRFLDGFSKN